MPANPPGHVTSQRGRRRKQWFQGSSFRSPRRDNLTASHPGVLTPFLSISTAFSSRRKRVSSFFASVIHRQYSFRCVYLSFSKNGSRPSFFSNFSNSGETST